MNILIVDGNEKKASDKYKDSNMLTQYEIYKNVIEKLSNFDLNITTIHPACLDKYMPKGLSLDDFDGIIWTGSVLNIYDYTPSINRQIELAKELFTKKNKIFGSCWGLQVLATAAGGAVRKNPKGLEAVIASDLTLNEKGVNHKMYRNKPKKFDAFCWHFDEVESLPNNSVILSSNTMSKVQSFSFFYENSEIWAVQYHPEFNPNWISGLMNQRKSLLLEERVFNSIEKFEQLFLYLSDIKKHYHLKNMLSISDTLISDKIHTIELSNWLDHLKNSILLKN